MDQSEDSEVAPPLPVSDPILKYWQKQRDLARTAVYTQPLAVGAYQLQWGGFRVHRFTSDPRLSTANGCEEEHTAEDGETENEEQDHQNVGTNDQPDSDHFPELLSFLKDRMSASSSDNPFGAVPANRPGLRKWRVESFAAVEQPVNGQFHTGDTYILLHNTVDRPGGAVHQAIHFWIGAEASQDEMGTAAILASQLDNVLGGRPTIHRHVQGQESEEFLQIFTSSGGVRYLEGGVSSGFKQASNEKACPVLYCVRGRRAIRITEMGLSTASLNSGSCFVLDLQGQLIQWNGKDSNPKARICALDLAMQQRDDVHGGGVEIITLDEGDISSAGAKAFFEALGCSNPQSVIIPAAPTTHTEPPPAVLYQMEGECPSPFFKEVSQEPLSAASLQPGKVLVLDADSTAYVWLGRGVQAEVRQQSLDLGAKFLASHRDRHGNVQVVKSGLEPPIFKQHFPDWASVTRPPASPSSEGGARAASGPEENQDLEQLIGQQYGQEDPHGLAKQAASAARLTIWLVKNFEMVEWPESRHGEFYSAESFVVLNSFESSGTARHVIYFWQGRESDVQEKGAAAMLTTKVDQDLNGKAVQVRVGQNKEPRHFLQLFKGNMVVHSGDVPEGGASTTPSSPALYHCKGEAHSSARAVQVTSSAICLNTSDVYILLDPESKTVMSWLGASATAAELECGESLAARLLAGAGGSYSGTTVEQGKEPAVFWAALGGKDNVQVVEQDGTMARLFVLSDAKTGGKELWFEEVHHFTQDDLLREDIMLLDAGSSAFLWVGPGASANEKSKATAAAEHYLKARFAVLGKLSGGVAIQQVQAGSEPAEFTAHFIAWDPRKTKEFEDPYESKLGRLKSEQAGKGVNPGYRIPLAKVSPEAPIAPAAEQEEQDAGILQEKLNNLRPVGRPKEEAPPAAEKMADPAVRLLPDGTNVFSADQLKGMTPTDGIDCTQKEAYLSDEEFASVFGMDRATFNAKPLWRRRDSKRRLGLF